MGISGHAPDGWRDRGTVGCRDGGTSGWRIVPKTSPAKCLDLQWKLELLGGDILGISCTTVNGLTVFYFLFSFSCDENEIYIWCVEEILIATNNEVIFRISV